MNSGHGEFAIRGMNRLNGQGIDNQHEANGKLAHIRQSLWDIFTTPIGSRIHRRDYGSYLFMMIDAPMNPAGRLRLAAALVDAAARFEPRVTLTAAAVSISSDGHLVFDYQARTLDDDELTARVYLQKRR